MNFSTWRKQLSEIIESVQITRNGISLGDDPGFQELVDLTLNIQQKEKHIFFIGNGASASIASHIAADLCKNGMVKTEVFTDLALLTALVNDLGVEQMFATPLKQQAQQGDLLIAISSSGESTNILNAVEQAQHMGMTVVTFTGMNPNNSLRASGDLNFYIPAPDYGFAESGHASLLHFWVDDFLAHSLEQTTP